MRVNMQVKKAKMGRELVQIIAEKLLTLKVARYGSI